MTLLTYGWIALGGALGSMARAWVGLMVARATGPEFPWGTILINIVGSFVIGCFGALTVSGGRLPASADIRAFVLIGLCGGFTTFSSFSLQTLDLARDGRPGQAIANIAISVILCLASVTAGYYAGSPGEGHARLHQAEGTSMGEVVVTLLNQPDKAPGLLAAAARLVELGGGGRVEALAIRTPPFAAILPSEEVLTSTREAELRAEAENWSGRLKTILDTWMPSARRRGIVADWIDVEGDPAEVVAERGGRADTVVVASRTDHDSERERQGLHAALFDTGRPVLLVPPGEHGQFGRVVAIAWRNDTQAAKSVLAAMPLLRRAAQVHVLQAADTAPALPPILREHGIEAQLHAVSAQKGAVGECLLQGAHDVGADLLVMGAYAHGPWREALLGGVTRHMLAHADLPILMRH